MAMSLGGGTQAQINMTPMIDILLVLIIIFLVITPQQEVGLKTLVPQPAAADTQPAAQRNDVVISVLRDGTIRLNQQPVDFESLPAQLQRVFHGVDEPIFVRGEKGIEFRQVAQVIDIARGAGIYRIGLMTQ